MLRADTTAAVVNDEEKRARADNAGTQSCSRGLTALTSAVRHFGQGVTGRPPWSLGLGIWDLIRLVFARGLRLRRRWRDVLDQLRVVLVDTPDVSARTAIVRDIRVHAWERQIVGGVLATRRTGRSRHAGRHCSSHGMCQLSHKRIGHVAGRRGRLKARSRAKPMPFVSRWGIHTVPPGGGGHQSLGVGRQETRSGRHASFSRKPCR